MSRRIGNTALREAVGAADSEMVQLLLEAGADPAIPGWMAMSALDKASFHAENSKPDSASNKIYALLKARRPK